jgi:hypothetical protein
VPALASDSRETMHTHPPPAAFLTALPPACSNSVSVHVDLCATPVCGVSETLRVVLDPIASFAYKAAPCALEGAPICDCALRNEKRVAQSAFSGWHISPISGLYKSWNRVLELRSRSIAVRVMNRVLALELVHSLPSTTWCGCFSR